MHRFSPELISYKKVLLRLDLNVPIKDGKIIDTSRIERSLATIKALLANHAAVIIMSHLGRPKGQPSEELSLALVADSLGKFLQQEVKFFTNYNEAHNLGLGEVALLENIRFHPEEERNDLEFAKYLASLGEFFINDAFSCSHRAHASICAIAEYLPSSTGLLLEEELDNLHNALNSASRPKMAIIGGAKISTKIDILYSLLEKIDYLVIGGAMANNFLYITGHNVGQSMLEKEYFSVTEEIIHKSRQLNCEIVMPRDAIIATECSGQASYNIADIDQIPTDKLILDIGPKTVEYINSLLYKVKTVLWNGPLGAFEVEQFRFGTNEIAKTIAQLTTEQKLISVAGGGDIVAALSSSNYDKYFTYISTAGGAFLEWLEGKELPALAALNKTEQL